MIFGWRLEKFQNFTIQIFEFYLLSEVLSALCGRGNSAESGAQVMVMRRQANISADIS
jgi:hypothetical protein